MVRFVELKKVQKDGETAWDKESVEKLAMEWCVTTRHTGFHGHSRRSGASTAWGSS